MKVFIAGLGSWGCAIARVLADNGHEVLIYGRDRENVRLFNETHRNMKYFPDIVLSETIKATDRLEDVRGYRYVVLALTSVSCCPVTEEMVQYIDNPVVIINLAKGFHPEKHTLLSDEITAILGPKLKAYAALLGPTHAEEVIIGMHSTINVVCEDQTVSRELQQIFANGYFRVYRNDDLIGAQYASALKNIIAIASGIHSGLGLGDNAKASLITRGLAEMTRYGLKMGGRLETFMGLCGMGDLIVTCTSVHSRNWQAGYAIGQKNGAEEFWRTNTKTVEGCRACKIIHEEALKNGIVMPITSEVYSVLYEGKKPSDAIRDLMDRQLKPENY